MGRAQFVAVHQRGDDADNGIEADNNEFGNDFLPRANPQIYNMTMCGDPDRNEGGESNRAVLFRRGTAVTFRNFLITGFKTTGLQIDGASTLTQVNNGTTQVGAGVIWGIPTPAALERRAVHRQRTVPGCAAERRRRPDGGLLQSRGAELPADVGRDAGGRAAHADSAAERRLLRGGDLHRRGRPESRRGLDARLDVVSAAMSLRSRWGSGGAGALLLTAAFFLLAAFIACRQLIALSNTLESPEALARAVLTAFAQGDVATLERLALTENEFRYLVWPQLPASRPERNVPWDYVWKDLQAKSRQQLRARISEWPDGQLELVNVEFTGEKTDYGTYRVHRDTVYDPQNPGR